MCNTNRGFTLVEVIIAIVIVGILALISTPVYRTYVKRGYTAEGKALIGEIDAAQQIYYSRNGQFYQGSAGQTMGSSFGVDARRNKYFTSYEVTKIGTDKYKAVIEGSGNAAGISLTLEGSLTSEPTIIENL